MELVPSSPAPSLPFLPAWGPGAMQGLFLQEDCCYLGSRPPLVWSPALLFILNWLTKDPNLIYTFFWFVFKISGLRHLVCLFALKTFCSRHLVWPKHIRLFAFGSLKAFVYFCLFVLCFSFTVGTLKKFQFQFSLSLNYFHLLLFCHCFLTLLLKCPVLHFSAASLVSLGIFISTLWEDIEDKRHLFPPTQKCGCDGGGNTP